MNHQFYPMALDELSLFRMRSFIHSALFLVVGLAATTSLHAGTMVTFTAPPPAVMVNGETVTAKVHLAGVAKPSTVKILLNKRNLVDAFNLSRCVAVPCDLSATLSAANGVHAGWNYLVVTVRGASGSADSARARFYSKVGVSDPTNGSGPPYAVHLAMTASQGIEVDYTPAGGNAPNYYLEPNGSPCSLGELTLLVLNRTTLSEENITCYGTADNAALTAALGALTTNDLVLGSTAAGQQLGPLNLSRIGGTDFSKSGAPTAYGYSVVGYGSSSAGIAAYESYNTNRQSAWHGLYGSLVNIASSSPIFAFSPTDNPGFAVQSGTAANAVVGDVMKLPLGQTTPPDQILPSGLFQNKYVAKPSTGSGIYVIVLDRYTLAPVSTTSYSTNCSSCSSQDLTSTINQLAVDLNGLDSSRLVILTSFGGTSPFAGPQLNNSYPISNLLVAIQRLGISPYAFNQLTIPNTAPIATAPLTSNGKVVAGAQFAMVGYPGAIPSNSKWYSSIWEGDTGNLRGVLTRNHLFQYEPVNVRHFDVTTLPSDLTADDLLAEGLSYQMGAAPPVPWPLTETSGQKSAYAYISNQLVTYDMYCGANTGCTCEAVASICSDIRFFYTGDEIGKIINGEEPASPAYPGDTIAAQKGFVSSDFTNVSQQLSLEKTYLGNAQNYQTWLQDVETNGEQNIGTALTSAATDVSTELSEATPMRVITPAQAGTSAIGISSDVFNGAAGIASIAGVLSPPVAVVSGILWTVSAILSYSNEAEGAPTSTTYNLDPAVSQLDDLLSTNNQAASSAAAQFNANLQQSTGTFFNGVYSDWFKLQTVGLLTVNPANQGWYIQDAGNASTIFNPLYIANARTSFYLQTLPLYFEQTSLIDNDIPADQAAGYSQQYIDSIDINMIFQWNSNETVSFDPTKFGAYSWNRRPSFEATADKCQDYSLISTTNSTNNPASAGVNPSWSSAFGNLLMGPPNAANGTGNLNISQNFLFDRHFKNNTFSIGANWGCSNSVPTVGVGAPTPRVSTVTIVVASRTSLAPGDRLTLNIIVKGKSKAPAGGLASQLLIHSNGKLLAAIPIYPTTRRFTTVSYQLDSDQLVSGENSSTASYLGNGNYLASNSAPVIITVGKP